MSCLPQHATQVVHVARSKKVQGAPEQLVHAAQRAEIAFGVRHKPSANSDEIQKCVGGVGLRLGARA